MKTTQERVKKNQLIRIMENVELTELNKSGKKYIIYMEREKQNEKKKRGGVEQCPRHPKKSHYLIIFYITKSKQ
jgi:hypothetical protein